MMTIIEEYHVSRNAVTEISKLLVRSKYNSKGLWKRINGKLVNVPVNEVPRGHTEKYISRSRHYSLTKVSNNLFVFTYSGDLPIETKLIPILLRDMFRNLEKEAHESKSRNH